MKTTMAPELFFSFIIHGIVVYFFLTLPIFSTGAMSFKAITVSLVEEERLEDNHYPGEPDNAEQTVQGSNTTNKKLELAQKTKSQPITKKTTPKPSPKTESKTSATSDGLETDSRDAGPSVSTKSELSGPETMNNADASLVSDEAESSEPLERKEALDAESPVEKEVIETPIAEVEPRASLAQAIPGDAALSESPEPPGGSKSLQVPETSVPLQVKESLVEKTQPQYEEEINEPVKAADKIRTDETRSHGLDKEPPGASQPSHSKEKIQEAGPSAEDGMEIPEEGLRLKKADQKGFSLEPEAMLSGEKIIAEAAPELEQPASGEETTEEMPPVPSKEQDVLYSKKETSSVQANNAHLPLPPPPVLLGEETVYKGREELLPAEKISEIPQEDETQLSSDGVRDKAVVANKVSAPSAATQTEQPELALMERANDSPEDKMDEDRPDNSTGGNDIATTAPRSDDLSEINAGEANDLQVVDSSHAEDSKTPALDADTADIGITNVLDPMAGVLDDRLPEKRSNDSAASDTEREPVPVQEKPAPEEVAVSVPKEEAQPEPVMKEVIQPEKKKDTSTVDEGHTPETSEDNSNDSSVDDDERAPALAQEEQAPEEAVVSVPEEEAQHEPVVKEAIQPEITHPEEQADTSIVDEVHTPETSNDDSIVAEIQTPERNRTLSQKEYHLLLDTKQTLARIETKKQENTAGEQGLVLPIEMLNDIEVEVYVRGMGDDVVFALERRAHPMEKGSSKKRGEAVAVEVTDRYGEPGEERVMIFVERADKGVYTLKITNNSEGAFDLTVNFRLYGGRDAEKQYSIQALTLKVHEKTVVKFLLPEAVFWDEDGYFTGAIESSGYVTKFNADTGLVWKEKKGF